MPLSCKDIIYYFLRQPNNTLKYAVKKGMHNKTKGV